MDRAVLLMRIGAGLSLLGLVVTLVSKSAFRDAVEKTSASSTKPLTADQVNAAVTFAMAVGIFLGLVGIGLWLWMASANGKGKSWARIVATVFFGLSVLSLVAGLAQTGTLVSRLLSILSFLVGAVAIFFMYRKESSAFYRAASAPRS